MQNTATHPTHKLQMARSKRQKRNTLKVIVFYSLRMITSKNVSNGHRGLNIAELFIKDRVGFRYMPHSYFRSLMSSKASFLSIFLSRDSDYPSSGRKNIAGMHPTNMKSNREVGLVQAHNR